MRRVDLVDDVEPWERARREGWEGVIAKRRGSPYEHRRSKHWLKMKCESSQEFVVGGFTDPQGSRVGLGALLVGYYAGEDLVFAGKLGTGFRYPAPPGSAKPARCHRDPAVPIYARDGTAARARALGPSGSCRAGRVSRMDSAMASCATRVFWASVGTRPRATSAGSRDHSSRQAHFS
jgi:hypothetical protein